MRFRNLKPPIPDRGSVLFGALVLIIWTCIITLGVVLEK